MLAWFKTCSRPAEIQSSEAGWRQLQARVRESHQAQLRRLQQKTLGCRTLSPPLFDWGWKIWQKSLRLSGTETLVFFHETEWLCRDIDSLTRTFLYKNPQTSLIRCSSFRKSKVLLKIATKVDVTVPSGKTQRSWFAVWLAVSPFRITIRWKI